MAMTIVVERTPEGRFMARTPELIVTDTMGELLAQLNDAIARTLGDEDAIALRELSKTALRTEVLDQLVERHPAPQAWRDEPAWDAAE